MHSYQPGRSPAALSPASRSCIHTRTVVTHHGLAFEGKLQADVVIHVVPSWIGEQIMETENPPHRVRGHLLTALFAADGAPPKLTLFSSRTYTLPEIDRDSMFKLRCELGSVFEVLGIPCGDVALREIGLWAADRVVKSSLCGCAEDRDLLPAFFANSQARFDRTIAAAAAGEHRYDLETYALLGVSNPSYSHIEHFSWIYHRQIETLRAVAAEANAAGRAAVVVDLATGGANFILSAIAALTRETPVPRVRFIGIDCSEHDMRIGAAMIAERSPHEAISVEFKIGDLTAPGFADELIGLGADFVVVNHALEHLPGFAPGNPQLENLYIHNWLLATRHSLSIAVPYERALERDVCGHEHAFDVARVTKLGRDMEIRSGQAVVARDLEVTALGGLVTIEKLPDVRANGGFGGTTFTVRPVPSARVELSPVLSDFHEPFNAEKFNLARRAPVIGKLTDAAIFASRAEPRQVRQLPIKFPGTPLVIPIEFRQFAEAAQLIADHNAAVNPWFERAYGYLNVFRGMTRHDAYRGLSLNNHGDQLQTLDPNYAYLPDYSYIISSTLPTTLYNQPFDMSEAVERYRRGERVNLYDDMNAQGKTDCIYRSENFGIYLLSPYVVHAASLATCEEYRVFMKIAFSLKRFYDNRELRTNPALDTRHWYGLKTRGYVDGFLQHAHFNERFLAEDIPPYDPAAS